MGQMSQSLAPSVSVVLPCYNTHKHLSRAIESVLAQTHPALEIIVVDDGSTDPTTITTLDALPDKVTLIRQENRGLPGARNSGIAAANGDYIVPLDCDDWLDPAFLERGLRILAENPKAGFAFAQIHMEGEITGILKKTYNFFDQLFFNQLPYCLLLPRATWAEIGGYDEAMRRGYEDWEFNIRLGANGYFGVAIPAPLFHYTISSTGMLGSQSRRIHTNLWAEIRRKHRALYSISSLRRISSAWRNEPHQYPQWVLVGWLLIALIFPLRISSFLFGQLMHLSHSRRTGTATQGVE